LAKIISLHLNVAGYSVRHQQTEDPSETASSEVASSDQWHQSLRRQGKVLLPTHQIAGKLCQNVAKYNLCKSHID